MGNGHGVYLSIDVDHPATYLARLKPYKRLAARANAAFPGIGTVMLNFSLLTPDAHVALDLIRRHTSSAGSVAGRCRACGYDLRATPGRCPECGAVPPPAGS